MNTPTPPEQTEDRENREFQEATTEAFRTSEPIITRHSDPPRESQLPQDQHDHIMQFFAYDHLPEHLQNISRLFAALAGQVIVMCPRNPERTVALRKLLEAKDAAVRAVLAKP